MPHFTYTLTTTIGSAEGTIDAPTEQEAKKRLQEAHKGPYTDADGKVQQNVITSLELTEAA